MTRIDIPEAALTEIASLRAANEELRAEVERLTILDGDREQLEQDLEAYEVVKGHVRAERDSLRSECHDLRGQLQGLTNRLAEAIAEVKWRTEAMQSGHDYLRQLHDQLLKTEAALAASERDTAERIADFIASRSIEHGWALGSTWAAEIRSGSWRKGVE